MGKGSDRRPMDEERCSHEEFRKRWDRIFSSSISEKTEKDNLLEGNEDKKKS